MTSSFMEKKSIKTLYRITEMLNHRAKRYHLLAERNFSFEEKSVFLRKTIENYEKAIIYQNVIKMFCKEGYKDCEKLLKKEK